MHCCKQYRYLIIMVFSLFSSTKPTFLSNMLKWVGLAKCSILSEGAAPLRQGWGLLFQTLGQQTVFISNKLQNLNLILNRRFVTVSSCLIKLSNIFKLYKQHVALLNYNNKLCIIVCIIIFNIWLTNNI